jgi:hypothetical protein
MTKTVKFAGPVSITLVGDDHQSDTKERSLMFGRDKLTGKEYAWCHLCQGYHGWEWPYGIALCNTGTWK